MCYFTYIRFAFNLLAFAVIYSDHTSVCFIWAKVSQLILGFYAHFADFVPVL